MLGMADPWIALVYIICIISAIGGVIYGALNWNTEDDRHGN